MDFSEIFDARWWMLLMRYLLNLSALLILIRFFYFRRNRGKREFFFAYISFSSIIFVVCALLSVIPVELGFALGLFAVFSIIRFRSIQITPRELTYLLVSLGLALLNALASQDYHILRLVVTNILVLITIGATEYLLFKKGNTVKFITYDNLDLLKESKRELLEKDLAIRFEIQNIKSIQVGDIDIKKGRAGIKVTFQDQTGKNYSEPT